MQNKTNIVIIEDESFYSDYLSASIFEKHNDITIHTISSISELDRLLNNKDFQYSAVICDMNLYNENHNNFYKINGLNFLRHLKNTKNNIPIALYSSKNLPDIDIQKEGFHFIKKGSNTEKFKNQFNKFIDILTTFNKTNELLNEIEKKDLENRTTSDNQIIQIKNDIKIVNDGLLKSISQNPNLIHEITWRRFEELIAELLVYLKYDITIGNGRNDGGKDIISVKKDTFSELIIAVECKHYTLPHKVGRPYIQKLLGVVEANNYNGGIIATSSFFTKQAHEFAEPLQPKILLKDFYDIEKMLKDYKNNIQ